MCVLIPPMGTSTACNLAEFPMDIKRNMSGCFKLLGVPIGNQKYCSSLLQEKRIAKAREMYDHIPLLEDGQIALKLLSRCLGSCKLMYNMRTTRSDWILSDPAEYDALLRETFEASMGLVLNDREWKQATLALSKGGLGLRSAEIHSSTSYLASRTATRSFCQEIDPSYVWDVSDDALEKTRNIFNNSVNSEDHLTEDCLHNETVPIPQRVLSKKIDHHTFEQLHANAETVDQARLLAVSSPLASKWLSATPSPAFDQRMAHAEFTAGLQLWLGLAVQAETTWCPKCDQIMDIRGMHCLTCMANGDAIVAHNEQRDHVFRFSRSAGLNPEREESGLLRTDPRRRPGDVSFSAMDEWQKSDDGFCHRVSSPAVTFIC